MRVDALALPAGELFDEEAQGPLTPPVDVQPGAPVGPVRGCLPLDPQIIAPVEYRDDESRSSWRGRSGPHRRFDPSTSSPLCRPIFSHPASSTSRYSATNQSTQRRKVFHACHVLPVLRLVVFGPRRAHQKRRPVVYVRAVAPISASIRRNSSSTASRPSAPVNRICQRTATGRWQTRQRLPTSAFMRRPAAAGSSSPRSQSPAGVQTAGTENRKRVTSCHLTRGTTWGKCSLTTVADRELVQTRRSPAPMTDAGLPRTAPPTGFEPVTLRLLVPQAH